MKNEDIDNLIDEINQGKFESQIADIFENLKKDNNIMEAVERIFEQTTELNEIQCMLIILLKKQAKEIHAKQNKGLGELDIDEKAIAGDIAKLTRDILEEKMKKGALKDDFHEKELAGIKTDKKDKYRLITGKAREDYKKQLKQFAVYELYKLTNPKRVAGESKKINFGHNMYMGGTKLASKYEGGQKHDVAGYSRRFIKETNQAVRSIKRTGPLIDR